MVAFLYLASVGVVVALTRAWPDNEPAIFTLLAAGTLLVVLFMDMVPPAAFGRWRRPLEGIGAIVFLGLLMALTGAAGSPFLVGFYLVVAGTALSAEGRAPIAVALVGTFTIAMVGLLDATVAGPLEPQALAWVGINAVSLILLADIATAAARSQRHARDEALRASRFDALTGLYNRSFFFTTMEQEIRRSDRMGRGFTLLMLDLDDLKPVNDTFGHQWGDRLLKAIADVVRRTVRFTDAAARYGGDEFVVLLPETDAAGGYVVAEKLRRDIAALTLHAADRNVRSSISVGLVAYPDDGSNIEQLVSAADVAMYEAKRRGKNRIVGYQTRTERVATDIDADTHDMVQLDPAEDVRTGGDPAPWGDALPEGGARVSYGDARDHPLNESPLRPPGRRRSDHTTISVEPDDAGPAPWSTEVYPPTQPPVRPSRGPPDADEPPEPPTRMRTAIDAGDVRAAPDASDQPWLTRTDTSLTQPPQTRTGRADDAPPQRPAARPARWLQRQPQRRDPPRWRATLDRAAHRARRPAARPRGLTGGHVGRDVYSHAMSQLPERGFGTRAIKAATRAPRVEQGPAAVPIYQSATFHAADVDDYAALIGFERPGYTYARIENPTADAMASAFAELHGAEAGFAFGSGMGAIHAALISLLRAGDRIVCTRAVYGSTRALMERVLARLGVQVVFVDPIDLDAVEQALATAPTRLLYAETISNPTIVVADLARLAEAAHRHGAVVVVDNTFASPYLCRPLELGVDIVLESATKWLAGHSDVIAGAVAGSAQSIRAVRDVAIDTGGIVAPFSAFLVLRGMQTLHVRMDRHSATALALAMHLDGAAGVRRVVYPGHPGHPQADIIARELRAGGGMLALELASREVAAAFIDGLTIPPVTATLGSVVTYAVHPPTATHRQLDEEQLREAGIPPGLVRISAGLEDAEDLLADVDAALAVATGAGRSA